MTERLKTKCRNCGKMTDISESKAYLQMRAKCQYAVEKQKMSSKNMALVRKQKIGQITAMHLIIKRLYNIMTPKQRKEASMRSQILRDEMRRIDNLSQ